MKQLEFEIRSLPFSNPGTIFNGAKYSFSDKDEPFSKRSHSLMTSLIVKVLWKILDNSKYIIEIEPRFHYQYDGISTHFSPDIVVYKVINNKNESITKATKPVLFIDYESPNSSDARIGPKDIVPFIYFCESIIEDEKYPVYLILTSHRHTHIVNNDLLPILNYSYNRQYKEEVKKTTLPALDYWSSIYKDFLNEWKNDNWHQANNIVLANISDGNITFLKLDH